MNTPMGTATCRRCGELPVDVTEPEDVADTVLFLASDGSKFVTAHEMAVGAGVTEF